MIPRYMPRYDLNKEYESNLSEARIQAGLTIHELCDKINISITDYCGLNSGERSPVNIQTGKVIPAAIKLAEIFAMNLSDLWPRYFCSITQHPELSDDDIAENFHQGCFSIEYQDPELILLEKELYHSLEHMINFKLSSRDRKVFKMRFIEEKTHQEIGDEIGFSCERIRQLCLDIVRRLKWHRNRFNRKSDKELEKILCLD